jgi:serine/threonine-protein kinase
VAYQHVREEPQPPSVYDPEVTPEMDAIVLKALTKDPDYRYQSADEMRLDIEACLDGQPVAATAAMGAVGYGGGYGGYGADAPTTALPPQQDPGTAMLPPMRDDDGGYGYDERPDRRRQPKKNHTSTILLVVAGILVLVGAIFMGKALFSGNGTGSDTVTVPQFVGSTETEAKTLATNGGVTIAWGDPVACDDQKKGLVCKQSATANSEIAKDQTVTLNLSTGPTQVTVPDVTGKTEDEARSELEGKGFNVEVESKESTSDDEGTVLNQDPKGDSKAAKGATVTITVAKAPAEVTVKNVVGQDVNAAKKTLQDQGFKVVTQTQESSDVTENQVISQNPTAGSTAQVGDTVTLVIATPPTTTALPNVVGQTLANAKSALADLNLNLQVSGSNNDDAIVTGTNPTAGTAVKDGDTVVITTVDSGNNNGGNNFIGGNNG